MTLTVASDRGSGGISVADAIWETVDPLGSSLAVFARRLPPREARFGALARPLPESVAERLGGMTLWSHQAQAIDLVRAGRSVAVATGTASGKSLCFQVPLAEAAANPVRAGTSLLIYPTKALAHDQLRALTERGFDGVVAGAYDGDAGSEERAFIRRKATTVLTNPEMLHSGLLPHHDRWSTFLARLQYVVLDELHVFRGIFGSHVVHVIRRLRRLARRYGADPTFVCCSATIGAPGRLASAITGLRVEEVLDDGSPCGEKQIAIWNPPQERRRASASAGPFGRMSCHDTTASLMTDLVAGGHRTLAFCRSRRVTELIAADVRRRLPPGLDDRVKPYRGGYLAEERREVEEQLFAGQLDGVVATNALELGVDLAGVDAVVLDGFPGTVASFWQQAGRSGREQQPSAAVLVAGEDQLDQWFASHPAELLNRPPEPAVVNPANPYVADLHLRCAAQELPLSREDERYWPDLLDEVVCRLALDDQVMIRTRSRQLGPQAMYTGGGWPSHDVSLRIGSGKEIRIRTTDGESVGTVERGRACEQVHPGAVYLHSGATWRVTSLDLDERVATVVPDDGSTYTVARTTLDLRVLSCDQRRRIGSAEAGLDVGLGWVEVHQQVTGYQRKDVGSRVVVATEELDLPPSVLRTRAFWYEVGTSVLQRAGVAVADVGGALHAAEHAGIGVLPLFAICDRWDVGGVSTPCQGDLGQAAIIIYDGYEGGAGVAELGFEAADRHLETTLGVIEACCCTDGCPSCVQSPKCGNGNDPLDKAAAVALLRTVLRSVHGN